MDVKSTVVKGAQGRPVHVPDVDSVGMLHGQMYGEQLSTPFMPLESEVPRIDFLPLPASLLTAWGVGTDPKKGLILLCRLQQELQATPSGDVVGWSADVQSLAVALYSTHGEASRALDPTSPFAGDPGSLPPAGQQAVVWAQLDALFVPPKSTDEHRRGSAPNPFAVTSGPHMVVARASSNMGFGIAVVSQVQAACRSANLAVRSTLLAMPIGVLR